MKNKNTDLTSDQKEASKPTGTVPTTLMGRPKKLNKAVTLSFTIEKAHLPMILDLGNGNRSAGLRAILASRYEEFLARHSNVATNEE